MNFDVICTSMSAAGTGLVRVNFEANRTQPGLAPVNLAVVVSVAESKQFTIGEEWQFSLGQKQTAVAPTK